MDIENNIVGKLRRTANEYIRVLKVTKKPTNEEFQTVVKVSGLGILLIGFVGFLLQMIRYFLFK